MSWTGWTSSPTSTRAAITRLPWRRVSCPRWNVTRPPWQCRPQPGRPRPAPTTSTSTCRDPGAAGDGGRRAAMSSALDRLHPVVVHPIVKTLGWPSLRALQDEAADPGLDGADALLLAPTAGGRT